MIDIVVADITTLEVDAVVNAANGALRGGGGVDGAIHRASGPQLMTELKLFPGCPTGEAVRTRAYTMKAKYVIHAVGPKMGEGDEDKKLSSAVRACLALADRHGLKSIAMPAISTGAFGFPIDRAARIILTEIQRYLQGGTKLLRVVVVLYGEDAWKIFAREMRRGFR